METGNVSDTTTRPKSEKQPMLPMGLHERRGNPAPRGGLKLAPNKNVYQFSVLDARISSDTYKEPKLKQKNKKNKTHKG